MFIMLCSVSINASETLPTPNKVLSFDSLDSWSIWGGGSFTTVCPVTEGDGAMKISGNGTQNTHPKAKKSLDESINGSDLGVIAFAVKKNLPRVTTNVTLRFGQGSSYSSVNYDVNVANLSAKMPLATYWIAYDASEDTSISSSSSVDSVLVSSPSVSAPYSIDNTIDALYTNAKGQPTIVIGFDDANDTISTIAYPYMSQYDLVGTVYLPTDIIGTTNALTWDQVTTLFDAGWAISIDGSPDDSNMLEAEDLDTAVENATSQWDVLEEHGVDSDAMYHMCFPNGKHFDSSIKPVHISQMTTDGTSTVVFDKAYDVTNGMRVYGANIPDNTYVINNGGEGVYSVKLSAPIPAQTLPAMFNDETGDFYLGTLPAALAKAGMKSGRITGGGDMYTRFGFGDREMTTPGQGVSYMTFKQVKPLIEQAVLRGTTLEFYFHRIVDDPDEGWTESTPNPGINVYESFFKEFIDYVYEKQQDGELDILTKPEWYERDIDASVPNED
ncbi:polysaccharide deacetylase family protein [Vibrio sp.]|nr:polysaccharide deacetylase family protein [Vibrio sp.]